ncbi:ABC transporter ATP-binding protein [Candidatus Kaiserbacteria bacterium]|nr:ABC transporter ATP-binding protein [Candidatus Kaiserbacteria bacterium]
MSNADSFRIYRQLLSVVQLARKAYAPYRRQILALTGLGFVGGILEGIGINAVIPLLTGALGLQSPATDALSQMIQTFFAFIGVPFVPRFLLAFIVILFIGKAAMSLWINYIQIRIANEYERATRAKLFSMVLRASWPYLLRQKLGNLETLLMIDTPAATSLLSKLSFTITLLTGLLMYLAVAFSISPVVTLATLLLGAFIFVSLRTLIDRVHGISRTRAESYRDTMHHVTEHVGGLKSVKAFGVEQEAITLGNNLFERIKALTVRIAMFQATATQLVAPIGIIYIATLLSLAFKTAFISIAALPAILYLIYRIFTYVQQLQNNVQYISELAPHLERVVLYESDAADGVQPRSGNGPFIFNDCLEFDAVSFAYVPGKEVLKGLSFQIRKGSMVGIVGPSGAGKTTTVDLILRLLEGGSGAIKLDSVDAREISLEAWRENVAYVSQDLFLLHDTIRNNIRFYDDSISESQVWEAARMAHIDDFIKKSPDGLDTLVGDRGIRLSAGERQRIVIARALARKPQLLILDEATSALDNESEAHIKKVIEELKGRITIVAIAHRLSTIMGSDSLIVLSDGRLVEEGSPEKLLADTSSYFYKVSTINQ